MCFLHCEAQRRYAEGKIKGRGCTSAYFAKLLKSAKKKVPELADLHPEQSFLVLEGKAPQLLDACLFENTANTIAGIGTPAFNFIKGAGAIGETGAWVCGEIATDGLSIGQGAALRLGGAVKALKAGTTCRPDMISQIGGTRKVFENKFWFRGKNGKKIRDKLSDLQEQTYPQIGDLNIITDEQCGCA